MRSSHFGQSRVKDHMQLIPSTTFPTTIVTKSASSRQLAIFGGLDEVASNKQSRVPTKYELQKYAIPTKYERHHSRPQDANRTSVGSDNLPSQTIPNPRVNASVNLSTRKPEFDEELLKMFQKVEINIPLLDAIKQIPKYTKFLKELCAQEEEDERRGGIKRYSISIDPKQRIHYRNTTSTAKEMLRPQNIFYPMHHWRLYLCRCHVGPKNFN
ncbi:hypothetical protein CR513_10769, partial [Mucuna pruriens]